MFYEFKGYKLRLDAMRIVQLEKALGGKSPLSIFAGTSETNIPQLGDLLLALHAAFQPYNHGTKLEDVYKLYDQWNEEGMTFTDLIPLIVDIYKVSGLIPKEVEVKN